MLNISSEKQARVIAEVEGKCKTYETRMSSRLTIWEEIAALYSNKLTTGGDNQAPKSQNSELFKAVRARTNMKIRMLTSYDPFFELTPNDILAKNDPASIIALEAYVKDQLYRSKFKGGLHRALTQLDLYGTVAVHEPYEPIRYAGPLAKSTTWVTGYKPVPMISCAFAIDSTDLSDSAWVCLSDVGSINRLYRAMETDPKGEIYNITALQKAIVEMEAKENRLEINAWAARRLSFAGFQTAQWDEGALETRTYYGTLDCMNDGIEYLIEIVNRKYITRMEEIVGLKPVRVCVQDAIDIEPMGIGLGEQFRNQVGEINRTRRALGNVVDLLGACMFKKSKNITDEASEFELKPFGFIQMENPGDSDQLAPNPQTIPTLASYEDRLVQGVRQGTGATDTMQAVTTGDSSTATEVSLAMNESVRSLSVQSEIQAPVLVGEHVRVVIQNGQRYRFGGKPITLKIGNTPVSVDPATMMVDTDVQVKTMTDQSFRPARVTKLLATLKLITSIPPGAIQGHRIDPTPTVLELLRLQEIPDWRGSIIKEAPQPLQAPQGPEASPQSPVDDQELEALIAQAEMESSIRTPAGETLTAPGDSATGSKAMQAAVARGGVE